ncbi:hypothetical protein [Micromonospora sp. NPDC005806]|uniref:hypothetical protein n=1 Tax=Micromonospora sp. NPDC005806 TaxID=3364234 RepID=UPI003694F591
MDGVVVSNPGESGSVAPTMLRADEEALLGCIADGRAVLLLGQGHTAGLVDNLIRDIAALSGTEQQGSLPEQLQELGTASRVEDVRRAFSRQAPDEELLQVASCPWSLVIASAVDPVPVEAFARAGGRAGRRIRVLNPSQATSLTASVNPAALTIVRLFGSADEQVPAHLPPLTRAALRQRQAFDVGPILQQVPFLASRGCLVVAGVGEDDWLPMELLALACSSLPPGSVHWFLGHEGSADPAASPDFGDTLTVHEGTLAEFLVRGAAGAAGEKLVAAQDALLSPDDHIISFGRPGDLKQIVLSAQEWRSMSQAAVILDDAAVAPPPPLLPDEDRAAFRFFLRGVQRPPDWTGVVRGYLFEREIAGRFAERVEEALTGIGAVNPSDAREKYTVYYSRRPILLTGPPASGKSRLIHWLAVHLRRRGHVVVYVAPTAGRVKSEALERVCRLLEEKGAPGVALLIDDLDNLQYSQLAEMLAAAGRNAVVVGSARVAPQTVDPNVDPRKSGGKEPDFTSVSVGRRLAGREIEGFRRYLNERGELSEGLTPTRMREPYFLLLLYFLLPDTRGNVRLRVGEAYDRLARALDLAARATDSGSNGGDSRFQEQLRAAARQLFPNMEFAGRQDNRLGSPFDHSDYTRDALDLCLVCARLHRPISVDLLLRALGADFVRRYPAFSRSLGESELLNEMVDEYGTVTLNTDHPELARLALGSVRPSPPDQLKLIELLVQAVRWSESNYPGDDQGQDFCIEILQTIGPRGEHADAYSSPDSLSLLARILRNIRQDLQVRIPKLLLLEAQALRLLADRDGDHGASLGYIALAVDVLDQAEDVLLSRRATDARNAELLNVLTTRAAVHGYAVGAHLRRLGQLNDVHSDNDEQRGLRLAIEEELERVSLYVGRTRALGRASFFPLDISFWSLRDVLEQMPGLSNVERARLLAQMSSILETAVEEPLEPRQVQRFRQRRIQLAELEGRHEISAEMALEMRKQGDFTGHCQIIRRRVYSPTTRKAHSPAAAAEGLASLLGLDNAVWRSREAMALAHHLWMDAHLPEGQVGGADPVFAHCSRQEWKEWSLILHARRNFPEDEDNAFVIFCLAWALFQLDEPHAALAQVAVLESNSSGSRRRVGCLAVLADDNGVPRSYRAIARRRQADNWICYLPQLLTEIRIPLAILGSEADLQVGSEISAFVGLNYRGLLPWSRRTDGLASHRVRRDRSDAPSSEPSIPRQAGPPTPSPAMMPRRRNAPAS